MTTTTQPTDSQMLDFLIKKQSSIYNGDRGGYCIRDEHSYITLDAYPTPRQAIAAEMAKEAK